MLKSKVLKPSWYSFLLASALCLMGNAQNVQAQTGTRNVENGGDILSHEFPVLLQQRSTRAAKIAAR